ncbi:multiple sugar-binding protein precursor [Clostridium puniceum]|uniref:Multiple sugar-binding protein n=1 Tax=Clostridium puniceum TaxID=29367 RepID=A0A1S8T888_9CLOT|nr:extracellular solute-binding protein [Clostridium puniceum]OOM73811.1 multiple sugar-binding protein precursor [Clostridium puniceum]
MKRKRLLSLTLATVLTIGTLAGCSSTGIDSSKGKSSDEKVTIKLFTGKIETIDVMNEIIDDFNKSQDKIIVKQEYQKDASNIIKTKFASDDVPDIMTTYEQGFADEGKYLDLGQESAWWDRMSTKMKEACTDVKTGKQYRICTNMTMAGFFYNKDIFKELGIEVPADWNDFVKDLEKIKTEKPDVIPWFIFGNEAWHLGHLIEFIPHGYIKSTLGTVEAKKAMINNDKAKLRFGDANGSMAVFAEKLVELQKKGLINADVLTATNDNCVQDFVNGKAAMFSNGMWVLSSLLEANPEMKDKIGFAPYPGYMPDSKPVVLSAEDSGYSISATTKHKEEAIQFLNFLFNAENQKKYSEVAKSPSAFKDVNAEWAPDSIVTQVNNAIGNAVNIGFTNEKPAGFSGDDAGRLVQELLANKYTPETFAKTYEQYWDDGMKNTK